jgi:uncharacterized protein
MKYLVVLLVVVLVLWLARAARRTPAPRKPPPAQRPPAIEEMVRCAHCGVHLPRSEALPGRGGLFCGASHRAEHEREPAPK